MTGIERHGLGWSYRISYTGPDGKRKYKRYSGFPTQEAAEKALLAEKLRIKSGKLANAGGHTVETWFEYWYENHALLRVAETTAEKYKSAIKALVPEIGHIPLDKLRPTHIQPLVAEWSKILKPSTVKIRIDPLRISLNDAVAWDIIERNPCDRITMPSRKASRMTVLTAEQMRALLDGIKGTPLYLPVLLASLAGLRRGEIAGLRWENIDLARNTIAITETRVMTESKKVITKDAKTENSQRSIRIPDELTAVLADAKKCAPVGEAYVCLVGGKSMRPDYMTLALNRAEQRLGLPHVPPHGLRHSHATLLLSLGVHPKVVQERLGHARINTTMDIYSHVLSGLQEDAAAKAGTALMGAAPTKAPKTPVKCRVRRRRLVNRHS